jgi:uncharacterized repeat protein (TIGR01451 family)
MIAPGGNAQFQFVVYNAGNAAASLAITNEQVRFSGGAVWTNQLIWDVNRNGAFDIAVDRVFDGTNAMAVGEDSTNYIVQRLVAKGSAPDRAALTNDFFVTNRLGPSVYQDYFGYDPKYGTAAGHYAGPQWYGHVVSVYIGGPDLRGAKFVSISNTASYRSVTGVAPTDFVPGTMLVYAISFTNRGSGELKRLRIWESIPANTVYMTNSMRRGAVGSTYVTATTLKDGVGDDAPAALGQVEGYYDDVGKRVSFTYWNNSLVPDTAVSPYLGAFYRGKVYFAVVVQ